MALPDAAMPYRTGMPCTACLDQYDPAVPPAAVITQYSVDQQAGPDSAAGCRRAQKPNKELKYSIGLLILCF
jgi:hypothetical protein